MWAEAILCLPSHHLRSHLQFSGFLEIPTRKGGMIELSGSAVVSRQKSTRHSDASGKNRLLAAAIPTHLDGSTLELEAGGG